SSHVCQLARAVAPNSGAALNVGNEVQFLGNEWQTSSGASSSACSGVVKCTRRRCSAGASCRRERWKWKGCARINPVAEAAHNSHNFVVAPSRICGQLHQSVRSAVQSVAARINEVIKAAARTRGVDKEVVGESAAADCGLRTFDSNADCELIPVLRNAESIRT